MAYIGLKHMVFAPLTAESDGSAPTYGNGAVLGRAMTANVTFDRDDAKLYADDALVDSDNTVTGGTISVGVDDLTDAVQVAALGMTKNAQDELLEGTTSAPYVGCGYMRKQRIAGSLKYIAYWVYKAQFAYSSDEASTKGQNTEFQTPTLDGTLMGVIPANDMKTIYRKHKAFDTEAAAIAYLDGLANISSNASSGT